MRLPSALLLTLGVVGVSAVLWAQDKPAPDKAPSKSTPVCVVKRGEKKPAFPINRTKDEKTCSKDKKTFNHNLHLQANDKNKDLLKGIGTNCGYCHTYVAKENMRPNSDEQIGDIRRPGHKACLGCHGIVPKDQKMPSNGKPMLSFYTTDPKERTICANCHGDALGPDNKPIAGSYNDMTKPLTVVDYGIASDEPPCDVEFGFDFSHKTHAEQSCRECHAPIADCKEYVKETKDLPPEVAKALGLDKPDAKPTRDAEGYIVDGYGNRAWCAKKDGKDSATLCDQQVLSSPSHPQCWACHAKDATRGKETGKNPYDKAGADRCDTCHVKPDKPSEGGLGVDSLGEYFNSKGYHKNRDFWAQYFTHKNHMAYLTDQAPKAPEDAQCRICHQSQVEADSLGDVSKALHTDIDQKNMCFCCHDGNPAFTAYDIMMTGCFECHDQADATPAAPGKHKCLDGKKYDETVKKLLGIEKLERPKKKK